MPLIVAADKRPDRFPSMLTNRESFQGIQCIPCTTSHALPYLGSFDHNHDLGIEWTSRIDLGTILK
jgi:hypothetical protein